MWKPKVVDLSDNLTTVTTNAVRVKGFYVNTVLSAHTCLIKNGTSTIFIIPASTAAGTLVDFAGEDGVTFSTNVIVDPDDAATGNITILYKESPHR